MLVEAFDARAQINASYGLEPSGENGTSVIDYGAMLGDRQAKARLDLPLLHSLPVMGTLL